jgi:hypothetical protein
MMGVGVRVRRRGESWKVTDSAVHSLLLLSGSTKQVRCVSAFLSCSGDADELFVALVAWTNEYQRACRCR